MTDYLTMPLEIKQASKTGFSGYGSVFGNVDLGGDVVIKGAFTETLAEHKEAGTLPQMFWMHDMGQVPGQWSKMTEDDHGLAVEGHLLPTTLGKDLKILMQNKAVRGLSIGFNIKDYDYSDAGIRLLKSVNLVETSLVSLAMNPLAKVEAMKARLSANGEYVQRPREFERFLRDSGYSRTTATQITAKVFSLRDADDEDDELLDLLSSIKGGHQADIVRAI